MKHVSRDIDPRYAQDLADRVPRACLSFANENGIQVRAVGVKRLDSQYLVCIPEEGGRVPASGQEAVLLIDEGIYYFELRAIYIRGQLKPTGLSQPEQTDQAWYELVPMKVVAWDYATLHEVKDEP